MHSQGEQLQQLQAELDKLYKEVSSVRAANSEVNPYILALGPKGIQELCSGGLPLPSLHCTVPAHLGNALSLDPGLWGFSQVHAIYHRETSLYIKTVHKGLGGGTPG